MGYLILAQQKARSLLATRAAMKLETFRYLLESFLGIVKNFHAQFGAKFARHLRDLRTYGVEGDGEKAIMEMLTNVGISPFNKEYLNDWLEVGPSIIAIAIDSRTIDGHSKTKTGL